jgi:hypothetical protein
MSFYHLFAFILIDVTDTAPRSPLDKATIVLAQPKTTAQPAQPIKTQPAQPAPVVVLFIQFESQLHERQYHHSL